MELDWWLLEIAKGVIKRQFVKNSIQIKNANILFAKSQEVSNFRALQIFERKVLLSI